MKKTKLLIAISLLGLFGSVHPVAAIGTGFTYQGRLVDAGSPASGLFDMRFSVYDSAAGGLQVGGSVVLAPVSVSSGLFTVSLDFGAGIFSGPDRWLQIESRVFGGPSYSLITPRQKLSPTPYSIMANSVAATAGAVPDGGLSANVALLNRNPQAFAGTNTFGAVGIGITPAAKLHVSAGASGGYHGDVIIGPGGYFGGEEHSINFDDGSGHIGSLIVGYDGASGYFSAGNLYHDGLHVTGSSAFKVFGNGNVNVDPANLNNGLLNNGNTNTSGLTFGTSSGEGIASKRTAGGNQFGLDFFTTGVPRMSILNGGFVGIGRQSPITGADIFSVRSPATAGYGGMYMDTAGATALPFYGYANNGSAMAWTYLDGGDGNKWKVYNGGDQLTVTPSGTVGIATTSPGATLDVKGGWWNLAGSEGDFRIGSPTYRLKMGVATAGGGAGDSRIYASGGTSRLVLGSSSNDVLAVVGTAVGIGTLTPTRGKLEITGTGSGSWTGGPGQVLNSGGLVPFSAGSYGGVSLYADSQIVAASFAAFSDERIKHIQGRSDTRRDLATLLGIEVTDYTYIDTMTRGTGPQKKVIAQQVEKVYPQAVHQLTDVLPDIYQKAKVQNGWVKLATSLKKGERVRLLSGNKEGIHEVLEVAEGQFRTAFVADGSEVFVYGREVKDFRSVDYEAIAMLNVSATQELNRRLEQQAAELKARDGKIATLEKANQEMRQELDSQKELASRLQSEFAALQKAVARLAEKSASTFALNHSPAGGQ